jgi:hypothetical protein
LAGPPDGCRARPHRGRLFERFEEPWGGQRRLDLARQHLVEQLAEDSQGNLGLNAEPGSDLDPNNPRFKAADRACKSLLPPRQAAPSGAKEANLRYARCMRAHGISDFPDPNPDGTLRIEPKPGTNLDPNNPQYKAADTACKHYRPDGGTGGSLQSGGAG